MVVATALARGGSWCWGWTVGPPEAATLRPGGTPMGWDSHMFCFWAVLYGYTSQKNHMKPLKMVVSKRISLLFGVFFSGSFLRFWCLFSGGGGMYVWRLRIPKKSPSINSRLGRSVWSPSHNGRTRRTPTKTQPGELVSLANLDKVAPWMIPKQPMVFLFRVSIERNRSLGFHCKVARKPLQICWTLDFRSFLGHRKNPKNHQTSQQISRRVHYVRMCTKKTSKYLKHKSWYTSWGDIWTHKSLP